MNFKYPDGQIIRTKSEIEEIGKEIKINNRLKYMRDSKDYYKKGLYSQALNCYQQLILSLPNEEKTLLHIGITLYHLNRPIEAEQFLKIIKGDNKKYKALLYIGLIKYDNCEYEMALTKFNEARENCKTDKNNIIYYYIKLLKCKLRYNDIPSALSNKAELNIVPNVVVELKAIIRIEQGKYAKAFDVIQKGLGKYPNDIGLLTQKIICYYYLKKYNLCIKEGEQALLTISTLQIKQKLNIHLYIGYSLLCVNKAKKAEAYFEWYEQIEKSSGKKDEYYIHKANICIQFKLADWREVIDILDKVLERNPNNITAIVTKFETYMKFNKKELGKEYYEKFKHLLIIENKEAINNLFNEEEECQMKSIQSTLTNYDRKLKTLVEMSINLNQEPIKINHHQSIRLCSSLSDPNDPDSNLDSSIENFIG